MVLQQNRYATVLCDRPHVDQILRRRSHDLSAQALVARVGAQVLRAECHRKIEQGRQVLRIGRAGLDIDLEAALPNRLGDPPDVIWLVATEKAVLRTVDVEPDARVAIGHRAIEQVHDREVRVVHQPEAERVRVDEEVDRGERHRNASRSAMERARARA